MAVAKDIKGLGPVYIITLMFFITKAKYPIYDRFAMAALQVLLVIEQGYDVSLWDNSDSSNSIVRKTSLPEKKFLSDKDEIELPKMYSYYIGLLNHFFGKEWEKTRDIDRALWVYGHYFDVP